MTVEETIAGRESSHGSFVARSEVAQRLQAEMRGTGGWAKLTAPQRQALVEISGKISRILCGGDANNPDHWHDIAGYATLAEESLPKLWCKKCNRDAPPHMVDCPDVKLSLRSSPDVVHQEFRGLTKACLVCGASDGHGGLQCPNTVATCSS